ncbi:MULTISPECIES: glycerol-3-phosphate dehydrogenase/oxidase [unclassified Parabacteroides]|uniref:glycerol-3-phosphate dehydrogenase/oxidase n=1 Tax=unclassified Parabacteroides TaxID=2649774 RepID=UPI00247594B4|nr:MULTISPECIES: glycerol-3-phosphate dehydrogenase/oxidase [unclassified Parabacteroides]
MKRETIIHLLTSRVEPFDFIVIGGGATGLGVALDATTRGYSVALFEQSDFTKATSSRSTKLVHGGVRYLAQGNVSLVFEALRERGILRKNAPHLVKDQRFLIPCYRWWEGPFYFCGLVLYDFMAGILRFGRSMCIGPKRSVKTIPNLRQKGLTAGILYHDGQFDDSRLGINLVRTAVDAGACVLNYMRVTGLLKEDGKISGVSVRDEETNTEYTIKSKAVINATGVFADDILQMDTPGKRPSVRPSQGVHLVLDMSFLQSDYAIMIPKTSDGRVLFAVPWHDKVVVGTTDTLMKEAVEEPVALEEEINFILTTAGHYLTRAPKRSDVLSVFAGLRPLAAPRSEGKKTKEISRSHKIIREDSGLISIIGGKWTTYRRMAQETVDFAIRNMRISTHDCVTETYPIHGAKPNPNFSDPLYVYGTDADEIRELINSSPEMSERLHTHYPFTVGEVSWIIRNEMVCTLEDVLARRLRILFMDARAALEIAPQVAEILMAEQGKDPAWKDAQLTAFKQLVSNYILND